MTRDWFLFTPTHRAPKVSVEQLCEPSFKKATTCNIFSRRQTTYIIVVIRIITINNSYHDKKAEKYFLITIYLK